MSVERQRQWFAKSESLKFHLASLLNLLSMFTAARVFRIKALSRGNCFYVKCGREAQGARCWLEGRKSERNCWLFFRVKENEADFEICIMASLFFPIKTRSLHICNS